MTIRLTTYEDISQLIQIFAAAQQTMRNSGNLHQWGDGYPSEDIIREDIAGNNSYVIEHQDRVVATFACIIGRDPSYATIYEGQWLDDEQPYSTIHRIASLPDVHGVAHAAFNFAMKLTHNLRIDTHHDNTIMRHILLREGFTYCGIIHLQRSGDERLAYQKINQT